MDIKIAYIGGGSKMWARVFMYDLALTDGISGEIALYDIDVPAAERNRKIGERINESENVVTKWRYTVSKDLKECLTGADFVVLSILPGTFDEMAVDVHLPERLGVYQSVGDTVGPGGVLRAMRTVPFYEEFARAVENYCPNAWCINFTNPMTICTKTLYDVFPKIKAFGCCHEVFHAQEFLGCVAKEELGVERPDRHEISIDACGVNHFTWISEAYYKEHDLIELLPKFIEKYFEIGYGEHKGKVWNDFMSDPFLYGNKVKMDLFNRYGVLAAAGDRHLVEFMNNNWYLGSEQNVKNWLFHLTKVDFRRADQKAKIEQSTRLANGEEKVKLVHSDEEAVALIKAILGFGKVVSNANVLNCGQMPDMPLGSVVETNCVFDNNSVKPITAKRLPLAVTNLVYRNCMNIETLYHGIKMRDLDEIFASFVNQPLMSEVSVDDARELFRDMIEGTKNYLGAYNLKKCP